MHICTTRQSGRLDALDTFSGLACPCADSHHQAAVKELELQQTAVHNLGGQAERLRKEIADAEALAERKRTELRVVTGACPLVCR